MYIDESVLREYLEDPKKFEALCKQKNEIVNWWFKTEKDFETLEKKIGQIQERINPYEYAKQDGSGRDVLNQMIKEYEGEKQLFKAYAFVLGGVEFDKNDNALSVDPRIMKIASGDNDFSNDLFGTILKTMTYNLVTNNYPNNLIYFLKKCKDNKGLEESIQKSGLVISHPWCIMGEKCSENTKDWRIKAQKDDLRHFNEKNLSKIDTRFPLKFLWMWANQDKVIHPLSLMAFREFLKSDFMTQIFGDLKMSLGLGADISEYAKKITNYKFDEFGKIWKMISEKIVDNFGNLENKQILIEGQKKEIEAIQQISLLISLLTLGETDMTNIDELLKTHKQIILYGVPGTGKTHSAKELIREWGEIAKRQEEEKQKSDTKQQQEQEKSQQMNAKEEDILKEWHFNKFLVKNTEQDAISQGKVYKEINSPIVWEIMQFHPNTTYQDFIGGITPKIDKEMLLYELRDGKFKKFCEYASANPKIPFVFIIDEINRANLSEVLGELLYALEYRDEGITIPNFDKPFVIPNNVYIIGTMNNVDKSLSTFDLALRRRFGFYEIGVDCDVIREMLKNKTINNIKDYIERCKDLNMLISGEIDGDNQERLKACPKLDLEKHYKIGQAYFVKIEKFLQDEEEINPRHLGKLWDYHLQPLLEEYIGFSMSDKDISNKLKNMKDFWTQGFKK